MNQTKVLFPVKLMGLEVQLASKQDEQWNYRPYLPEGNFKGRLKNSKPNWQKSGNVLNLIHSIFCSGWHPSHSRLSALVRRVPAVTRFSQRVTGRRLCNLNRLRRSKQHSRLTGIGFRTRSSWLRSLTSPPKPFVRSRSGRSLLPSVEGFSLRLPALSLLGFSVRSLLWWVA